MATCSQGPFQTFLTIQKVTHFTDWIIGHAHLALFGTFTYWNIGALLYVWPKVTGREFYSTKLNWSAYWLMTISFYLFYFFPLTALGLVEGFSWMSGSPFSVPILAAKPMWLFRFIGGAGMYLGFLLLAYNFWQTAHRGEPITPTPHPSSWQEQSRT
jgi:cytochrome c oxidase cbb3-type subunit 1